jgi:hypothetical protein
MNEIVETPETSTCLSKAYLKLKSKTNTMQIFMHQIRISTN